MESYLKTFDNQDELRENLFNEFLIYADYKNAGDWNKGVRLCECLAIIGWGNKEPLQAIRGQFVNGSPTTCLQDKYGNLHFVDAMWSKRKLGVTMEMGRTSYFQSLNQNTNQETILRAYPTVEEIQDVKLLTQRNWIAKAPIHIQQWLSNCYKNSKFIANELRETLCPLIDNNMRPEIYGNSIQFIRINVYLSYSNCNYYITDDHAEPLSEEQQEYPFFLQESPRFKYGNFMKKTGMAYIDLFLEKEFSDLSQDEQRDKLAEYFLIAIKTFAQKYQKKLNYPFDVMIEDFEKVLNLWLNKA